MSSDSLEEEVGVHWGASPGSCGSLYFLRGGDGKKRPWATSSFDVEEGKSPCLLFSPRAPTGSGGTLLSSNSRIYAPKP